MDVATNAVDRLGDVCLKCRDGSPECDLLDWREAVNRQIVASLNALVLPAVDRKNRSPATARPQRRLRDQLQSLV
jgi:hypothetical protein